jgi:GT2 family glycosyltransferase
MIPSLTGARPDRRVAIVIATRDRAALLRTTLAHHHVLPERPRVLVVDNGSTDETAEVVAEFPDTDFVLQGENGGASARNIGVRAARSPYVAFGDDDLWWAPGALTLAADLMDAHLRLAVIAARILVGPEQTLDQTCREMATSPLPNPRGSPGRPVLGFLACGVVVRRAAYLNVGGFSAQLGIGGEEELLAIDLAAAGWDLAYIEDIVAYHHPAGAADPQARRRRQVRNALWCAWLRRPPLRALRRTWKLVRCLPHDAATQGAFLDALKGLDPVLRQRRAVPAPVERSLRLLDA